MHVTLQDTQRRCSSLNMPLAFRLHMSDSYPIKESVCLGTKLIPSTRLIWKYVSCAIIPIILFSLNLEAQRCGMGVVNYNIPFDGGLASELFGVVTETDTQQASYHTKQPVFTAK